MRKPIEDKTWTNFMAQFRQAHQELRDTDTTIEELGFQSANTIIEQSVDRLRVAEEITQDMNVHPPPQPPQIVCPIQVPPQANVVITQVYPNNTRMQIMIHNMQMMQDNMHQIFNTLGKDRGRDRERGRGGRGQGRGRNHTNGGSYCYTHGSCNHMGLDCNTPGLDHNPAATFSNMLSGSTLRYYWITE